MAKRDEVNARVLKAADLLINDGGTVRSIAKRIGSSKSTIHKDFTERLPKIDDKKAKKVLELLAINKSERHFRGGASTKRMFEAKKLESL